MGCKMVDAPLSYQVKVNLEEMKNVPVDKSSGVNTRKKVDPGRFGDIAGKKNIWPLPPELLIRSFKIPIFR